MEMIAHLRSYLSEPVSNTSLVIFRMAFGLLIAMESFGAIFTGWVKRVLVEPEFTFSFIGFEWLQPLPGYGMYYYYSIMGLCGLLVMLGLFYRYSLGIFTLMWWGSYLMQKTSYNNHYYLLILFCIFMLLVPAHANASLDTRRNQVKTATTCPRWCIELFKWQLLIVYSYAAIAKLYPGWLEGEFISISFASKLHYPVIGELLQNPGIQKLVIIGGVLYDATIIPLMYWPKSRRIGLLASIGFHLFNSIIFGIGIFPYLMLATLLLFFSTSSWGSRIPGYRPGNNTIHYSYSVIVPLLTIYFILQLWLPLRHHFIKGDVLKTEEGHRMAWRMMLRSKSGTIYFKLKHRTTGKSWMVFPKECLTVKQAYKIGGHPDMIWQFSQFLAKKYALQGTSDLEVYANSIVSVNGQSLGTLIDPKIDLLTVKWNRWGHNEWIISD